MAFNRHAIEILGHYVYGLFDPRDQKRPFYIGKGKGNRVFHHVEGARRVRSDDVFEDDVMTLKEETIDEIHQRQVGDNKVVHKIFRYGMTQPEALKVEATLIDLINLMFENHLKNAVSGQGVAEGIYDTSELEISLNALPLESGMPLMIIKIERQWQSLLEQRGSIAAITHADLYEAAQGDWKVNVQRANRTAFALIVARGLVRDVIVPSGWTESTRDRKRMTGEKDASEFRHLIGKSVSHLFVRGSQAAVTYQNCP